MCQAVRLNTHPDGQTANLMACFDEDEKFYLVQEFVAGQNLDEELVTNPIWSESRVIGLLIDILSIVEFVHALNLSHGNLKPSNIRRRTKDQKLVLIDFGTLQPISGPPNAGSTELPQLKTPGYHPPISLEEWTDTDLDIYAVGMIGIRALTGIEAEDLSIDRLSNEVIWRFSIPGKRGTSTSPELATILDKMVSHYRENRYETVSQVLMDLQNLQPNPQPRPLRFKANKPLLAAFGTALLTINVGGYWLYSTLHRNFQESRRCNQALISSDKPENKTENQPLDVHLVSKAIEVMAACDSKAEPIQADTNSTNNTLPKKQGNNLGTGQKLCEPGFTLRKNWLTRLLSCTKGNNTLAKRQGTASLILGRTSHILNQMDDAERHLSNAQEYFYRAKNQDSEDPQSDFYRGLAKQIHANLLINLSKDPKQNQKHISLELEEVKDYGVDYEQAIRLYSKLLPDEIQPDDVPILGKLAAYLGEQLVKSNSESNRVAQSNQQSGQIDEQIAQVNKLYELAIENTSDVDYATSLVYNQSVINFILGSGRAADIFSKNREKINLKDPYVQRFQDTCVFVSPSNDPDLCRQIPGGSTSIPFVRPIYSCEEYPSLAIAKLNSANPDNLCD